MSSPLPSKPAPVPASQTFALHQASLTDNTLVDNPLWLPSYSYRSQQYRYLSHQSGEIGKFRVKVIESIGACKRDPNSAYLSPVRTSSARDAINAIGSALLLPSKQPPPPLPPPQLSVNPFCTITLSKQTKTTSKASKSTTKQSRHIFTSSPLTLPLLKTSFLPFSPVYMTIDVYEPPPPSSLLSSVFLAKGTDVLIGTCSLDLSDLLFGFQSGTIDLWLDLLYTPPVANSSTNNIYASTSGDGSFAQKQPMVLNKMMSAPPQKGIFSPKVHIQLQYKPTGISPCINDIVCLESFTRNPSNLVLSVHSPMKVVGLSDGTNGSVKNVTNIDNSDTTSANEEGLVQVINEDGSVTYEMPNARDIGGGENGDEDDDEDDDEGFMEAQLKNRNNVLDKGSYLRVQYQLPTTQSKSSTLSTSEAAETDKKTSARYGHLKIHRNCVFVVERLALLDTLYNLALQPTDYLRSTPIGSTLERFATPYVRYGIDVARPAIFAGKVSLKMAVLSVKAGGSGVNYGVQRGLLGRKEGDGF